MDEHDKDLERFEQLLERSSLGTSGARQLRRRTSAAHVDAARRIYQLRNRVASGDHADATAAAAELTGLLAELGYHGQADQVRHEWFRDDDHGNTGPALPSAAPTGMILMTDIVDFDDRTDHDMLVVRETLHRVLGDVFHQLHVSWSQCWHEDRGNGTLTAIPVKMGNTAFVDSLIELLATKLRRHNRWASHATRIQLRAALHLNSAPADMQEMGDQAVRHAVRLINAPTFKAAARAEHADLAVVFSDQLVTTGSIDPEAFRRIQIPTKDADLTGWMYLAEPPTADQHDAGDPAHQPFTRAEPSQTNGGEAGAQAAAVQILSKSTQLSGRRIVGAERQTLARDLVKRYVNGESIRAIAASTGRSYGFVHRVLVEFGVQLRQRGGARRRRKA